MTYEVLNTLAVINDEAGAVSPSGRKLIMSADLSKAWRLYRDSSDASTNNIRSFDAYTGALADEVGSTSGIFGTDDMQLLVGSSLGSNWIKVNGGLFGLVDFSSAQKATYSYIDDTTLHEIQRLATTTPLDTPVWDIDTLYWNDDEGDPVYLNGRLYRCIAVGCINYRPDITPETWIPAALAGQPLYSSTTSYGLLDEVQFPPGTAWQCWQLICKGKLPSTHPEFWIDKWQLDISLSKIIFPITFLEASWAVII